ncbi:transglycosylase SLT domain-containing protein [Tropicimonas sp. IMCC34011]|uniref:transglycosylase SLT domain-containing protein n=1 Tax=Tropicimonas sp. IMCC34011 TaxID=2248759 RepID=UPI000E2293E1|nr:transglycosylase SLT domain-containing protein [Tropicimonas sp. IMCC34011]
MLTILAALVLTGCAGDKTPPSRLDNACAIVAERPAYLRAMRATQRKWGVPVYVQMAVIHQESKFDGDARTPYQWALGVIPMGRQSSAYGYSQALDGTWDEYREEERRRRAKRDKIQDATDFMGWYMNKTVQRNGIPLTDARNQYLAYHEGHSGFRRGTYNSKGWLVGVADKVQSRAYMYRGQLASCGKL